MADKPQQNQSLAAGALAGAATGALLGAIIGGLTGIGPFVVLGGLCGAICGAAIGIMSQLRTRKRQAAFAEVASKLQLAYALEVSSEQIRYALELFPKWFAGSHWFRGKYRDADVDVFDIQEQESETQFNDEGKLRTYRRITRRETVVLLPIDDIPEFRIVAQSWFRRLIPGFGMRGMAFHPASEGDAKAIERFQRSWSLVPGSGEADSRRQSDQEADAVRALFSPKMMDSMRSWGKLTARVHRDCLLVARPGRLLPPEDRRELMDDAIELRMNLLASRQRVAEHAQHPADTTGRPAHITAK